MMTFLATEAFLGWHFFPSKVVLGNPYLSYLWTDLATFLGDF